VTAPQAPEIVQRGDGSLAVSGQDAEAALAESGARFYRRPDGALIVPARFAETVLRAIESEPSTPQATGAQNALETPETQQAETQGTQQPAALPAPAGQAGPPLIPPAPESAPIEATIAGTPVSRYSDATLQKLSKQKSPGGEKARRELERRSASDKPRQLAALIEEAISGKDTRGKMILRPVNESERAEILKQGGPDVAGLSHEVTAEELRHAMNRHGQPDEAERNPGHRQLTKEDLARIPEVLDKPDDLKVQPRGKNRTSVIYRREFSDGRIEYVERVFETSQKNEPRLTTKSVWVRGAATGVESSLPQVSTPDRDISTLAQPGANASGNLITVASF
jgi:hypothetical protein